MFAEAKPSNRRNLDVRFQGKYGQVEVGGNYVGAEFHHSLPLPSRISFYYPVANSIDLSTGYWKRDESRLFKILATVDGKTDTVGTEPCIYSWTPYKANFLEDRKSYRVNYTYHFCDSLPLMVVKIEFTNRAATGKTFSVDIDFSTPLRTCQTYAFKDTAEVEYFSGGSVYAANFRYRDTDSASVFVVNAGDMPNDRQQSKDTSKVVIRPDAVFSYSKLLVPAGKLEIVLLIGSCRIDELKSVIAKALASWQTDARDSEVRILSYSYDAAKISVPDSNLEQTAYWSKATLASDRHYINGSIVPMPCPAEYNFFFTHDVLLTDLGAVFFDLQRVKHDLSFIKSLTQSDSILPHAYYWRDDGFKTEFASADNWNHLWFAILCGTYLKHSNDLPTLKNIYPILKKSVEMALSNLGPGELMYSTRPDWWDIGNNYGARSYLTALMVRALREYSYVALKMHKDIPFATDCLNKSDELQKNLSDKFWNTKAGYLLDTFDTNTVDEHYYAGPLVAVDYNLLDNDKASALVQTAQKELVDENLGVRTAMPADFDRLLDIYKFKEGEVGSPYAYINGAVWAQTTAWYILALINLGKVDLAKECLDKYSTLNGISQSPNGQPSFFEYRFSDPSSSSYGKIDKPNFMWAGGWYLNSLYHLMGASENEWNVSVSPNVPTGFENMKYDLTSNGEWSAVTWAGKGNYFRKITVDGKAFPSAILTRRAKRIHVERGFPTAPYLEAASCIVNKVNSLNHSGTLEIQLQGLVGQKASITIVSPKPVKKALLETGDFTSGVVSQKSDGIYRTTLQFPFDKENESAHFEF